jgi:hypothetical protein
MERAASAISKTLSSRVRPMKMRRRSFEASILDWYIMYCLLKWMESWLGYGWSSKLWEYKHLFGG